MTGQPYLCLPHRQKWGFHKVLFKGIFKGKTNGSLVINPKSYGIMPLLVFFWGGLGIG